MYSYFHVFQISFIFSKLIQNNGFHKDFEKYEKNLEIPAKLCQKPENIIEKIFKIWW